MSSVYPSGLLLSVARPIFLNVASPFPAPSECSGLPCLPIPDFLAFLSLTRSSGFHPPKAKAAPPHPVAPGAPLLGPPLPWVQGVSALSWQTLWLQHSRQIVTASKEHSLDSETFRGHWEVKHGFQSCTAKSPVGRFVQTPEI